MDQAKEGRSICCQKGAFKSQELQVVEGSLPKKLQVFFSVGGIPGRDWRPDHSVISEFCVLSVKLGVEVQHQTENAWSFLLQKGDN